jgi:hypothetical protein
VFVFLKFFMTWCLGLRLQLIFLNKLEKTNGGRNWHGVRYWWSLIFVKLELPTWTKNNECLINVDQQPRDWTMDFNNRVHIGSLHFSGILIHEKEVLWRKNDFCFFKNHSWTKKLHGMIISNNGTIAELSLKSFHNQ